MFQRFSKIKLIILGLVLFGSLFFIGTTVAQNIGFENIDKVAGGSGFQTNEQRAGGISCLNTTIAEVINIFLGLIGVIFVGFMVYSGYQWMTAGGEEEKVTKATARIKNSAIALAIILLAFVGTRTVFTFFYQQAGERGGSNLLAGCASDSDCPFNYMCVEKVCQSAADIGGRRCEHNSDCPADQPICEQWGNLSDKTGGWANFKGWSFCTCSDRDCANNTFCVDISGPGSACRECRDDNDCIRKNTGKNFCDLDINKCVKI